MAQASERPELRSAHVIVVGNEKGGTGKSTLSIHIILALLKAGHRVASIDLDTRQRTLTRFLENRQSWAANAGHAIELPFHHALERGRKDSAGENEIVEFTSFAEAISRIEHAYEFAVIDTPASDSYLMRLAHSLADTLVTPMNDSFIDVDVLARVHNDRRERGATAQYAALVLEARRQRRLADAGLIDWVVVRNRMASLQSHNQRQVAGSLGRLSPELQFRMAEGFGDRVIFRELFPGRPHGSRFDRGGHRQRHALSLAGCRARRGRGAHSQFAPADTQCAAPAHGGAPSLVRRDAGFLRRLIAKGATDRGRRREQWPDCPTFKLSTPYRLRGSRARMQLAQPDVSRLHRGRLTGFSLGRLLGFVRALGGDVKIDIRLKTAEDRVRKVA